MVAQADEKDSTCKRPAWVVIELTTEKGKGQREKVQPFQEKKRVGAVLSRGAAVSGAYTVTQWPITVAACMTVQRVQGVGFEGVALWIPPTGSSRRTP